MSILFLWHFVELTSNQLCALLAFVEQTFGYKPHKMKYTKMITQHNDFFGMQTKANNRTLVNSMDDFLIRHSTASVQQQCINFESDCFSQRNQIPIYRVYCLFSSFGRIRWLINLGLNGMDNTTTWILDAINLDFPPTSTSPYPFSARRLALSTD